MAVWWGGKERGKQFTVRRSQTTGAYGKGGLLETGKKGSSDQTEGREKSEGLRSEPGMLRAGVN